MPKKPQQQAESNSHALSREDRKNEQICRMIERAEKLRLKKEQKKKLAVSIPTLSSSALAKARANGCSNSNGKGRFETETKFLLRVSYLPCLFVPCRI